MMNCKDFQNQIDDYTRADLGPEAMADSKDHLASCSECARALVDHNNLLASLKAMSVPGPSDGFAERALHIAVKSGAVGQHVEHHRRGFMVGFGSAAVAALALWVVVGIFPQQTNLPETASVESNNVPEFSIALNEQRDIKLAFYSAEELKGAKITLQMPASVALVGFPGQRELSWKTNLARGDNLLRLPVVATGEAGGQLVAHIEYMGKVKMLKVNLSVGAEDLSGRTDSMLRIV